MNYVIIGNSAAAVGCVEGIRQIDKKGKITIISDEPYHTYSRPLISYLLLGKTDSERMKYRDGNFYKENGVTALLGKKAVSVDSEKRKSRWTAAKRLNTTGCSPRPALPPSSPKWRGLKRWKRNLPFCRSTTRRRWNRQLPRTAVCLLSARG